MNSNPSVLAVIPARSGSKSIPNKNIRRFAGHPLIAHTIQFAQSCPEISRCVISTDSSEIARVARDYQGDVPFIRPQQLAQDDTPMWPVLQHALAKVEAQEKRSYDLLLLLDPTSPAREQSDVQVAISRLVACRSAHGIVGVSRPDFNPMWNCVVEKEGWMADMFQGGGVYSRRQDVPTIYRVNGSLYCWKTQFVRESDGNWRENGNHLMHEVPESRAMSFDTEDEFIRAEHLVQAGFICLPWLESELK